MQLTRQMPHEGPDKLPKWRIKAVVTQLEEHWKIAKKMLKAGIKPSGKMGARKGDINVAYKNGLIDKFQKARATGKNKSGNAGKHFGMGEF